MSILVDSSLLNKEVKTKLINDLTVTSIDTDYGPGESFFCARLEESEEKSQDLLLPLAYIKENFPDLFYEKIYPKSKISFTAELYTRQKIVRKEILEILSIQSSVIVALNCAFGKTIMAIELSAHFKLKVVVIVHRTVLIDQWIDSYQRFTCEENSKKPVKIQTLTTKNPIDYTADVYIINIVNVSKRSMSDFNHIGLLIVDEAHTASSTKNSQALTYFCPLYSIALTATPTRKDGKDKVLELYFGKKIIWRKLFRPFNAYIYYTKFKPSIQVSKIGTLDWNNVLDSLTKNTQRNKLIVDIICYFKARNILVLTKRVEQANILTNMLKEIKEDVALFVSSQRYYRTEARVLISTYSKTGVGFNAPKLDMFILACDVEEMIEQYLGRVFRREDVTPIVVDLCDNFNPLKKHLETRMDCYKETGASIKNFVEYFP